MAVFWIGWFQRLFYRIFFFPSLSCERGLLKFKGHSPNVEDHEPLEKGPEVTSLILGCYVDIYLTIVVFFTCLIYR